MSAVTDSHLGIRIQDAGLAADDQVLGTSLANPLQVVIVVLHAPIPVLTLTSVSQQSGDFNRDVIGDLKEEVGYLKLETRYQP